MKTKIFFDEKFKGLLLCSVLGCVVLCASPGLVSAQETTVNKVDVNSTIEIRTIAANYDETFYIKGTVKDQNGKLVVGVDLDITIVNGKNGINRYYNKQTNSKGQWGEISTQLSQGENIITVSLKGHPYYNDFTNRTSIIVNDKININSTITAPYSLSHNSNDNIIYGYLTDRNKKPVSNEYVTLTVTNSYNSRYEIFYLKTDHAGRWSINYVPEYKGSSNNPVYYDFEVSLKDHPLYNNFSNKTSSKCYY